jgi:hypothetical protein
MGLKGYRQNQLQWKDKRWDASGKAKISQKKWYLYGLFIFGGYAVLIALLLIWIPASFKNNVPYQIAVSQIISDQKTQSELGSPLETGWWVSGSNQRWKDGSGRSVFSFSVYGPEGKADVRVTAVRKSFQWELERIVVRSKNSNKSWSIDNF